MAQRVDKARWEVEWAKIRKGAKSSMVLAQWAETLKANGWREYAPDFWIKENVAYGVSAEAAYMLHRLPEFQSEQKASTKAVRSPIEAARDAVIRAAKAWVAFEDDGLRATVHMQGKLNERLARAVARLEKLEAEQ